MATQGRPYGWRDRDGTGGAVEGRGPRKLSGACRPRYSRLVLEKLTEQLAASRHLTDAEAMLAAGLLADEAVAVEAKADFLTQLARKGETPEEIAAFARCLRAKGIPVVLESALGAGEILDVVGTGGDRLSTFNISTTAALIAAAAGTRVAKHGNRASTSTIGSADVMEALGIPHDHGPEEAARTFPRAWLHLLFRPEIPSRVPAYRAGAEAVRPARPGDDFQLPGSAAQPGAADGDAAGGAPARPLRTVGAGPSIPGGAARNGGVRERVGRDERAPFG